MFVSYSEIIISVIVKHVQNTEIIRTPCLPGGEFVRFFSAREDGKIAGWWFASRESG